MERDELHLHPTCVSWQIERRIALELAAVLPGTATEKRAKEKTEERTKEKAEERIKK